MFILHGLPARCLDFVWFLNPKDIFGYDLYFNGYDSYEQGKWEFGQRMEKIKKKEGSRSRQRL